MVSNPSCLLCLLLFLPSDIVCHLAWTMNFPLPCLTLTEDIMSPPLMLNAECESVNLTNQRSVFRQVTNHSPPLVSSHRAHVMSAVGQHRVFREGKAEWVLSIVWERIWKPKFQLVRWRLDILWKGWFDFNRALTYWTMSGKSNSWKGVGSMEKCLLKL